MAKQIITGGTFHAPVTNADKIENSVIGTTVTKCDISSPEVKTALEKLLQEIQDLNSKIPAEQAQQHRQTLQDIQQDAELLIDEANRPTPRSERFKVTLKGLIEAAQSMESVASLIVPMVTVAQSISGMIN